MFDWFQTPTQAHDTLTDFFFSPSLATKLPEMMLNFANLAHAFTQNFQPAKGCMLNIFVQLQLVFYSDLAKVILKAGFTWLVNSLTQLEDADPLVKIQFSFGEVSASVPSLPSTSLIPVDYTKNFCHQVGYTVLTVGYIWTCERMISTM